MVRGIRRPEDAQGLGVSRRLLVRIGALLKKGLEVTPAVLEAAKGGSGLEALLLEPAFLEKAGDLDDAAWQALFGERVTKEEAGHMGELIVHHEDGVRVLCLREELEAGDGWDEPTPSAQTSAPLQHAGSNTTPRDLLTPSEGAGALARRGGSGGGRGGEELFSKIELDRLRLRLLTAANPGDRIEALRILAHAPLEPNEKGDLIFRALEDRDKSVRAEAASLLFVLGASEDLCETLAHLNQPEERVRIRAAERLLKRMHTPDVPELEKAAAAIAALAGLKDEGLGEPAVRLLQILEPCAPAISKHPARTAELVRTALGKISASSENSAPRGAFDKLFMPTQRLIMGLSAAPALLPIFSEERAKLTSRKTEAFLIQAVLSQPQLPAGVDAEWLAYATNFIVLDTEEAADSRAVGACLVRRGEQALARIVMDFERATPSGQKYFLRLIEDLARFQEASPEILEKAAQLALLAVGSTHVSVRMGAMNCRFVTKPGISEGLRAKLAEAYLHSSRDFGFPAEIEAIEDTVAMFGLPAVDAALKRLAPERPPHERVQAVRVLGNVALELSVPTGQVKAAQEILTEVIRRLQALALDASFSEHQTLYTALGKLAASPAASKQAATVATRTLLAAVKDKEVKAWHVLEGLTWIAASRRASQDLIVTVTGWIRRILDEAQAEIESRVRDVNGESVLEFGNNETLMDALPLALSGLSRIVRSRTCPPATVKQCVSMLCERWERICNAQLVWGPGNTLVLIRTLQEIGAEPHLPDDQRIQILKSLAPRYTQPSVLQALTGIFSGHDAVPSAGAALTLGAALLKRRGPDGQFDAEDRPDILRAISRIAARKHLGSGPEREEKTRRFRESTLDELFSGVKDLVHNAYEGLIHLRDAKVLPKDLQASLEKRLTEYHAQKK